MEQFFVGLLFGVLFSAAFYLLGVFAGMFTTSRRRLVIYHVLEVLLVLVLVATVQAWWGELFSWWKKSDLWLHEYLRRPLNWMQFLLGVVSGVLLRVWAVHVAGRPVYPAPGARQPHTAPLPAAISSPNAEGLEADRVATQDRRWIFAFVGLLAVAVLLPHFENLFRSMTALKVAGIEIAFKEQRDSSRAAVRAAEREKTSADMLGATPVDKLKERMESDERWHAAVHAPGSAASRKRADAAFILLYDLAIAPHFSCIGKLLEEGHERGAVRARARQFASPWFEAATVRGPDSKVAASLAAMLATSRAIVANAGCADRWKHQHALATTVDPIVTKHLDFHYLLAVLFHFLDDRLAAIQILERMKAQFADDINLHYLLGLLYFDEDPTLDRSLQHQETALRLAEQRLSASGERIAAARVACPDAASLATAKSALCRDLGRYSRAVTGLKNSAAYVLAHAGGADRLGRAIQLAREAVQATRPENGKHPMGEVIYWDYVDTFAYAVMAEEATSHAPDAQVIACAERVFREIRDTSRDDLAALVDSGKSGWRRSYLRLRHDYQIASRHQSVAGVLLSTLGQSGHAAPRCSNAEYQQMLKGEY